MTLSRWFPSRARAPRASRAFRAPLDSRATLSFRATRALGALLMVVVLSLLGAFGALWTLRALEWRDTSGTAFEREAAGGALIPALAPVRESALAPMRGLAPTPMHAHPRYSAVFPVPHSASPVGAERSARSHPYVDRWLSPLPGPLNVVGPFRAPETPYTSGHRGIDLPAHPGAGVRAPAGGEVVFAGAVADRSVVSVRVDATTVYALEPVTAAPPAGTAVRAGDAIGLAAAGGHCADECVHLGVRVDERYVSPLRFLLGRPELLPWDGD